MALVKHSPPPSSTGLLGLSPVVAGTACCAVSALGYTAANICMRQLAAIEADPVWSICVKEAVTVLVVGPWLVLGTLRGRVAWPAGRLLACLMAAALAVQLAGNLSLQWSYGIVGLAIAIPALFSMLLGGGAVMGYLLLGERVSRRAMAAIAILVGALVFLGQGAEKSSQAIAATTDPMLVALGFGAACLAGTTYASLGIALRGLASRPPHLGAVAVTVTGIGAVSLAPLSVHRLGFEGLLATPPDQFLWMLAAGSFNLVAFLAITKGLQLITVVHANVLNASQVAMAAVAGLVLFHEPPSPWLLLGVGLTLLGILVYGRPDGPAVTDQHA